MKLDHSMLAGHHAALTLLGRKDLDPWEGNTERSYYEEQVLTPDKKHEGTDILISEKAPPHESVGGRGTGLLAHIEARKCVWFLVSLNMGNLMICKKTDYLYSIAS